MKSTKDRLTVVFGLCLCLAAALYPPWRVVHAGTSMEQGYAWLWEPPLTISEIDINKLIVEWVIIGVLTTLVFIWNNRTSAEQ